MSYGAAHYASDEKMLKDINDLFGDYECGLNDSRPHVLGEFDLQDRDEFM